jgi:hypothetical protein
MVVFGQHQAAVALLPGNVAGTHCVGYCMGFRCSLEFQEKKKNFSHTGIRNTDRPVCSLVATLTTLSQLLYFCGPNCLLSTKWQMESKLQWVFNHCLGQCMVTSPEILTM